MGSEKFQEGLSFFKQVLSEFSQDSCMRMGAALAYYTVFALPPVTLLLVLILGFSFQATGQGDREEARQALQEQVRMFVGDEASDEVTTMIENANLTGGWLQWTLGILGVLVSATGVVAALQDTLNEAWEVQPDPDQGGIMVFIQKRLFSLGMILGLGFILLVSTLLTSWLGRFFGGGSAVTAALITFVVVIGLFTAIFKYVPDAIISWKDAGIGGAVTAVLFMVGKAGIDIYLGHSKMESQFGAAAAFAILLVWVYYTSLILLFGAELTQVWAKRYGDGIVPEEGAVRFSRKVQPLPRASSSPAS